MTKVVGLHEYLHLVLPEKYFLGSARNDIFLCFPKELKKCGVHEVVRVCEPTYERELLYKEGITVLVRQYNDCLSSLSKAL